MIFMEAMEQSGNAHAIGKSCEILHTSRNRGEHSEWLTWKAALSLAFSSLHISKLTYLCSWAPPFKMSSQEELKFENAPEGHRGCVSSGW